MSRNRMSIFLHVIQALKSASMSVFILSSFGIRGDSLAFAKWRTHMGFHVFAGYFAKTHPEKLPVTMICFIY